MILYLLIQGVGDGVCHILNELLTRELITQNYQFKTPKFLESNDNEEYIEMNENDQDNQIYLEEEKKNVLSQESDDESNENKLEEKDFRIPSNAQSQRLSSYSTSATSADENQIDPIEWQKELERVSSQLVHLDLIIENMDFNGNGLSKVVINY